jgi:hypothetical protein
MVQAFHYPLLFCLCYHRAHFPHILSGAAVKMTVLLDLPSEILLDIVECFTSYRDIQALAMQNRQLYQLAIDGSKTMFSHLRICDGEDLGKSLKMLLHILRNPRLGHHVRTLELFEFPPYDPDMDEFEDSGFPREMSPRSITGKDWDLLKQAAQKLAPHGLEMAQDTILTALVSGWKMPE